MELHFNTKPLMIGLAQIEMESLANTKVIFFLVKNSDARSSFVAKEKKLLWSKLGMDSWIGF
jgi:hypothetical protein